MDTTTRIECHPGFTVGAIDRRLFGSFVEHMGRVVYGALYDPGNPLSRSDGLRTDVVEAVRRMGVTGVRYPGGNFVSGHDWRDSVGPRDRRPRRLELAWRAIETHEFGLGEFMDWAALASVEPMLAVNLGTRGIAQAAALVEYCNYPGGTRDSDLRRAHGAEEPYGVHLWCLGNEMDGEWQIGQKQADEYGRLAAQVAKSMKLVDPSIELVSCGSCAVDRPDYPEWDLVTLRHTYPYVDYVAIHQYLGGQEEGTGLFLAKAAEFERFLTTTAAVCDVVKAQCRGTKTLGISVDEWGVWDFGDGAAGPSAEPWQTAPAFSEQVYTMEDTLLFASMMQAMLRHCDRVKIACQSLLTNISACIMTTADGVWLQPTFFPFADAARYARGTVLSSIQAGPRYDAGPLGEVAEIDAVVTQDPNSGDITVLAVNRSEASEREVRVELRGFEPGRIIGQSRLTAPHKLATNSADKTAIAPEFGTDARLSDEVLTAVLPALSWNVIRLGRGKDAPWGE